MNYYSTNHLAPNVDFATACTSGQAPDKGLYFPEHLPIIDPKLLEKIKTTPKGSLALEIMRPYIGGTMPNEVLQRIINETIDFDFPLVQISDNIYALELFHGPTMAFKDVGARFMSRCLSYFHKDSTQKHTVLVATSGDTGGAVANGFEDVDGIEVIILYPKGKVSPVQEKQLTTCAKNIIALEIEGVFDDCQAIVKNAFLDTDLNASYQLTSANSINVARWLPQQLYYFFAMQQWQHNTPPVICVPSGNVGNICAGLLAKKTGLAMGHFIAACNANNTVSTYINTGVEPEQNTVATISNAMDVAKPSNLVRIKEIFGNDYHTLIENLSGETVDDATTKQTMKTVFKQFKYVLDPHGAVAYYALDKYLQQHPTEKGIILETAHPVKFPDAVEEATGKQVPIPVRMQAMMLKEKRSTVLPADYNAFKAFMLQRLV